VSDLAADAWTKEMEDARASLRKRFPDLRCLRCGQDDFVLRMWPDETLVPGLASNSDNQVVELICENCGFQEKHVVRLLAAKEAI
jgi:transcription elongation factor Elf1